MDKTSASNDLAFIKRVMEESRAVLVENGARFIIWGALAVIGTALTYGADSMGLSSLIPWIWGFFGAALLVGTILTGVRPRRRAAPTFAGKVYASVWIGTIVSICLAAAAMLLLNAWSLRLLLSLTAGGLGTAYFISSVILSHRWMFVLSFVWWTGAAALACIGHYYAPLLLAALVAGCELVPGIVLYRRWRASGRRGG